MDTKETWPKTLTGRFICSKFQPMPEGGRYWGRWDHEDVHETNYDGDYEIELECRCCGHIWREEIPE